MEFWPRIFHKGAPIVHRGLNESSGRPKMGRVEETVDNHLVIARFPDEPRPVGYDRRELSRLLMIPVLSRGPVVLTPRHIWNILRGSHVKTAKP